VPIVSVQNCYNLADRDSQGVLDYCEKEKMGFLPWAPIGGSGRGALSKSDKSLEAEAKRRNYNPVQLVLAWLLQKSPVMLPIPGTANIAHLEENMSAAKIYLSPEEWKKIGVVG
jgi:pyridoxine 4-dehydrogenase